MMKGMLKFVHVEMLVSELETLFGILNVQTHTSPGLFRAIVYITLTDMPYKKLDKKRVEKWWESTDKSGKNYKIERIEL